MTEFNLSLPDEEQVSVKPTARISEVMGVVLLREALGISVEQARAIIRANKSALLMVREEAQHNDLSPFSLGRLIRQWYEQE